jgi:S-adenosylmethionine synthetase
MRIILAGRATLFCDGTSVPVEELAENASRRWLAHHLRALDTDRHVVVSSFIRPGASELVGLFNDHGRERPLLANDTSCGVGYAPLSEVELLVLTVEQHLNSDEARSAEPALGEDVKIMAVRHEDTIELTVACAMIDRALSSLADYAKAKEGVAQIALKAAQQITSLAVRVDVNAGDDLGAGRVYLTVTGTSAEAGDDGQAGRGNRANGLITPGRSMTIESLAGKNPVTHVGKLYNLAASLAAERIVASVTGIRSAECRLVSRIGQPIDEPQLVELRLTGAEPERDPDLRREVEEILRDELNHLPQLAKELVGGNLRLNRWPMRA